MLRTFTGRRERQKEKGPQTPKKKKRERRRVINAGGKTEKRDWENRE
jgi:hypothetical protein